MHSLDSNNFIGKEVRKSIKWWFISAFIILGFAALLSFFYGNYFYNLLMGPFPINLNEISTLKNLDGQQKTFVTFEDDDLFDTGYIDVVEITKENSKEVETEKYEGKFLLAHAGDKILFVDATYSHIGNIYKGTLQLIPDYMKTDVLSQIIIENPNIKREDILPVMFSELNKPEWLVFSFTCVTFMFGLWCLLMALRYLKNVESHPTIKALKEHGDPEMLALEIDKESKEPNNIQTRSVLITKSWFIKKSLFRTFLVPLSDIVWIHQNIIQQSVNFVPVKKHYIAVINSAKGKRIGVQMSKNEVEKLLDGLYQRIPWVIYGFSADIQSRWKKNPMEFLEIARAKKKSLGIEAKV